MTDKELSDDVKEKGLEKGEFDSLYYSYDELGTYKPFPFYMKVRGDRLYLSVGAGEYTYNLSADVVKDMMKVLRKVKA